MSVAWVLSYLVAVCLTGCALLRASSWHPPPEGVPTQLLFVVAGSWEGKVHLVAEPWSTYHPGSTEEERVRCALQDLLAYPAGHDEGWWFPAKRLHTMVPPKMRLLGVTLHAGRITPDFNAKIRDFRKVQNFVPGISSRAAPVTLLAQIVFTATQFSPDAAVEVLIEGKKCNLLGRSHVDISHPWLRRDFSDAIIAEDNGGRRLFP